MKENSIEKDEEILNNIKAYMQENIDNGCHKFVYNDLGYDEKCVDVINAIEHILKEYKRVLKENEQLRTEVNSLKKENKELKTITNQYEAYECEAPKDSRAKIIIADKLYFNNGYFKNNFIEIDKIKKVFEDLEKIIKVGEGNV